MKRVYIRPEGRIVELPDKLMLDMIVKESFGEGEASRESKFGEDEHDTEDHENFWDE